MSAASLTAPFCSPGPSNQAAKGIDTEVTLPGTESHPAPCEGQGLILLVFEAVGGVHAL